MRVERIINSVACRRVPRACGLFESDVAHTMNDDGLALVSTRCWDGIHPQPDAKDYTDPNERVDAVVPPRHAPSFA